MHKTIILLCFFVLFSILGCAPNETFYKYSYSENKIIRKVAIAPFDLFFPLPNQLKNSTDHFYEQLIEYVKNSGLEVVKNDVLKDSWGKERSESGGFYNQVTGAIDSSRFDFCVKRAIMKTCAIQDLDGILLPTVKIRYGTVSGTYVFWDGVARKVRLDDPVRNIEEFSYTGEVPVYSLQAIVLDNTGTKVFKSMAGIDIVHKLIYNGYKQISDFDERALQDSVINRESIGIGFHPFIRYAQYPKKPKFYGNKNPPEN